MRTRREQPTLAAVKRFVDHITICTPQEILKSQHLVVLLYSASLACLVLAIILTTIQQPSRRAVPESAFLFPSDQIYFIILTFLTQPTQHSARTLLGH
jgi:hypothetical protein